MYDEDMVNTINKENQAQYLEERALKNKILGMNPSKKQEEWNKHFPPIAEPEDSYLTGNVY